MGGRLACGWLSLWVCMMAGTAPASAKDVYTLALPTYLKGCAHAPHDAAATTSGR